MAYSITRDRFGWYVQECYESNGNGHSTWINWTYHGPYKTQAAAKRKMTLMLKKYGAKQ